MVEQNLSFKTQEGKFSYRVGAIIMESNNILMVKNSGEPYYYTVGGRVKFGESAQEAIVREIFEETQIKLEVDRLVFIHENFFTLEIENEPFQEVALFFLIKPTCQLKDVELTTFNEEYGEVTFHWLPIEALENMLIYPEFFKKELSCISKNIKHFITRDGVT